METTISQYHPGITLFFHEWRSHNCKLPPPLQASSFLQWIIFNKIYQIFLWDHEIYLGTKVFNFVTQGHNIMLITTKMFIFYTVVLKQSSCYQCSSKAAVMIKVPLHHSPKLATLLSMFVNSELPTFGANTSICTGFTEAVGFGCLLTFVVLVGATGTLVFWAFWNEKEMWTIVNGCAGLQQFRVVTWKFRLFIVVQKNVKRVTLSDPGQEILGYSA